MTLLKNPRNSPFNRPVSRVFLAALFFSLLLGGISIPRALRLESADFKVFYVAARHVLESPADLYKVSPDRYLYPPEAAVALVPFALSQNYRLQQGLWHLLLVATIFLLAKDSWAALAAMVILVRYLLITLGYGQINLVILALVAQVGVSFWGGLFWALACWLKVYPLVLLPVGLRRGARQFWLGAGVLSGVLLFLTFAAFRSVGFLAVHLEFLTALEGKGFPLHSHNQSIQALFMRLFTNHSFNLHSVGYTQWTLLDLPSSAVSAFSLVLGVGMASISWAKGWKKADSLSMRSAAAFSILFLSHIVWKDYLLFLFFPLQEILARGSRKMAYTAGGGFFALSMLSSPEVFGFGWSTRFDGASIHLWGAILVWGVWCKLQNCRLQPLS